MGNALSVAVRPVRRRSERSAFLNLPWKLYSRDPLWVPPLKASMRALLDVEHHPFYQGGEGAEAEFFLAWEGRDPIGRVAAIENHAFNSFQGEKVVHFGFFECVERHDVARALISAVESWAKARGINRILGPFNPSTNYECGLLVDGFNRPPVIMMTYNPAYYVSLFEKAGLKKAKDLLAYISKVEDQSLSRLERLAERTRKRHPELETRGADLSHFEGELEAFKAIYNQAWERNWGFVPMNEGEIQAMARELRPSLAPELLRFAFIDGEPAGFILALPDWNPVLKDLGGVPWRHPIRTIRHLLRTRPTDLEGLRLITMGVREEFRMRGIEGVLIAESLKIALEMGYHWCEYSWILEDNELTKRAVRLMDGELYKTYRIYEKKL